MAIRLRCVRWDLLVAVCLAIVVGSCLHGVAYANEYRVADANAGATSGYYIEYDPSLTEADRAGVSFDSQKCELTLNNASISAKSGGPLFRVTAFGNVAKLLTIKLVGKSEIVSPEKEAAKMVGLYEGWSVRVVGTGSLTTSGLRVFAVEGDVRLESGTLDLRRCPSDGGIRCDGTMNVASQARLSCEAVAPGDKDNERIAVSAAKMKNSYNSLGKVVGRMPVGAEIRSNNAVYKVTNLNNNNRGSSVAGKMVYYKNNTVTLTKWLSGTSLNLSGNLTSTIMGYPYRTSVVAGNAFNNKAGAKVKKLTLKPLLPIKVKKNAFKGMKGLTDLYLVPDCDNSPLFMDWSLEVSSLADKGNPNTMYAIKADLPSIRNKAYAKGCLSGAGKAGGKRLTVHVAPYRKIYNTKSKKWYWVMLLNQDYGYGYGVTDASWQKTFRNYLSSNYGLAKKAKISISKKAYKLSRVAGKYRGHWGYVE